MMYETQKQVFPTGPTLGASGVGGGVIFGNGGLNQATRNVATTAPDRESISSALDHQQQELNELHKMISILAEQLALVLRPQPPSTNGGAAGGTPTATTVLDRLRTHSGVINAAMQRLSDLSNRIEI